MNPFISVIVPIYNVEPFLPDSLVSLSSQDIDKHLEIILVNDGSNDGSKGLCDAFQKDHAGTTVINQENKGLSEARNAGINIAGGKWTFFFDADDRLAPDALSTLTDFAERQDCDMVVGAFYYDYDTYLLYDDRWYKSNEPFVIDRNEAMKQLILQKFFKNFAWGKLYRTEMVKKHLFRPGVFFEDSYWQHWMVNESVRVGVVPKPIYYYRQRMESISGSFSIKNLDLLKGTEERLSLVRECYPALAPLQEKRFERLVQSFMDSASASGNQEMMHAFSSFAEEHGIKPTHWLSKVVRSVYVRLCEKRPTILNKK